MSFIKKNKKKIFFSLILFFLYLLSHKLILATNESQNPLVIFLRQNIDPEVRSKIKQNFFPIARYKSLITEQNESIKNLQITIEDLSTQVNELRDFISPELIKNYQNGNIKYIKFKKQKDKNFNIQNLNYNFEIFDTNFLFNGKHDGAVRGSSAYIEEFQNNLVIVSGDGIVMYIDYDYLKLKEFDAKIIKSNFHELVTEQKIYKQSDVGIKGILILNNYIYLSYSNNKRECWNTTILRAEMNYEFLNFEEFFEPNFCAKSESGQYFFNPHSAGGKMVSFDKNNIIFTHGDYYFWPSVQDETKHFGKILLINIENKSVSILSKGHRNPQGLYYNQEKNLLINTEHGPVGGDEINLNFLSNNKNKIKNYGFPISSYGEHHCKEKYESKGLNGYDCPDYKLAPFYKSHTKYGFIEPLKYWVPSIGVTAITSVPNNFLLSNKQEYFIGALGNRLQDGDMSLHHITLNNDFSKVENENIIKINQRIRDLKYSTKINKLILYLETEGSIAFMNINKK